MFSTCHIFPPAPSSSDQICGCLILAHGLSFNAVWLVPQVLHRCRLAKAKGPGQRKGQPKPKPLHESAESTPRSRSPPRTREKEPVRTPRQLGLGQSWSNWSAAHRGRPTTLWVGATLKDSGGTGDQRLQKPERSIAGKSGEDYTNKPRPKARPQLRASNLLSNQWLRTRRRQKSPQPPQLLLDLPKRRQPQV